MPLKNMIKYNHPDLKKKIFCFSPILLFRSKRRGFVHYTMGQLKAIGETFYKIKLDISVLDQEVKFDTIHVSFKLAFENKSTLKVNSAMLREEARLPAVSSSILFEIFPFIIVFGEDMVIQTIGRSLNQVYCYHECK